MLWCSHIVLPLAAPSVQPFYTVCVCVCIYCMFTEKSFIVVL